MRVRDLCLHREDGRLAVREGEPEELHVLHQDHVGVFFVRLVGGRASKERERRERIENRETHNEF